MCREYFYSRNGREKDALIKFYDDEDNFDDTLRISRQLSKEEQIRHEKGKEGSGSWVYGSALWCDHVCWIFIRARRYSFNLDRCWQSFWCQSFCWRSMATMEASGRYLNAKFSIALQFDFAKNFSGLSRFSDLRYKNEFLLMLQLQTFKKLSSSSLLFIFLSYFSLHSNFQLHFEKWIFALNISSLVKLKFQLH